MTVTYLEAGGNMDFLNEIWGAIYDASLPVRVALVHMMRGYWDGNLGTLLLLVVVVTLWLGSACWASSIAETRLRNPYVHFVIGLVVPLVYAPIILFAMDVRAIGRAARAEAEEEEESGATEDSAAGGEVSADSTVVPAGETAARVPDQADAPAPTYDQAYFEPISRDDEGRPSGPWRIVYAGSTVTAIKMLEALPHALLIETVSPRTGQSQRLRVPYAKIESCERA